MPSQTKPASKRSAASRANGAKSRGPVTPEGRARSSQNAVRHGLTAQSSNLPPAKVVLTTESPEEFQSVLDAYLHQFSPQPGVETELVHAMVTARWRLRRTAAIDTMLLNNEMLRHREKLDHDLKTFNVEDIDRVTYAFQKLAARDQSFSLLMRYEGTLNRSHDRAFKQLQILQAARNRVQPNEPKPARTHSNQPDPKPLLEPSIPAPPPAIATVPAAPLSPAMDSEPPNAPGRGAPQRNLTPSAAPPRG
jgi:hypothetical protein